MRGTLVIVRAYGGQALVRRVWASDRRAVFVTTDELYDRLDRGLEAPEPMGFPATDVFEHDGTTPSEPIDWSRMRQWRNESSESRV